jgi:hypothetical protein
MHHIIEGSRKIYVLQANFLKNHTVARYLKSRVLELLNKKTLTQRHVSMYRNRIMKKETLNTKNAMWWPWNYGGGRGMP